MDGSTNIFPNFSVSFFFVSVKYLNAHTGVVFLRFPKGCYKLLWSALPFITSVESRGRIIPCFFNCLHVGGKAKKEKKTQNNVEVPFKILIYLKRLLFYRNNQNMSEVFDPIQHPAAPPNAPQM